MKRYLTAVLLMSLAAVTAGCPSTRSVSAPQKFAADPGSLVHKPSGIGFPARLGDFTREASLTLYVTDGSDVSAGYNYYQGADQAIAATTYVYPSPQLTSIGSPQNVIDEARATLSQREFAACKQEIRQGHPQAVLISEGPFTTAGGRTGVMAEYEFTERFAGVVQPVKSRLYLLTYLSGRWTVMHRITFPAHSAVQSKVDQYVNDFGPVAAH